MKYKGSSKRAVFLFRDMGTGGAQKIEAFVANALYEEGHEVIAVNMASSVCTVSLNEGIKIVNVIYDRVEKCQNKIAKLGYKFWYLLKLRRTLLQLKPDILCAFLSDVVRIAVLAVGDKDIPIIGSERGDPYTFTEKQFQNYRNAYLKCSGVVFQLEGAANKYNLPSDIDQRVIPNPCIPRVKSYAVRTESSERVIISAGRLAKQKRFDLLIDAFAIVHERFPDYKLYIYGDGPLKNQLVLQAQSSAAGDAITFMGDVKDVFVQAANADFFVLSSDFEGIPNVLLEAMATGIPCISTDCSPGGARYVLRDGDRGLIVPRDDKVQLAEAMIRYIENPALREGNASKGLHVIDEFSPTNIKEMWVDLFEKHMRR